MFHFLCNENIHRYGFMNWVNKIFLVLVLVNVEINDTLHFAYFEQRNLYTLNMSNPYALTSFRSNNESVVLVLYIYDVTSQFEHFYEKLRANVILMNEHTITPSQ